MSTDTARLVRPSRAPLFAGTKAEHLDEVLRPDVQTFLTTTPSGWRVAICDCGDPPEDTLPAVQFWDGGFDTAREALFAAWVYAKQYGLLAEVTTPAAE